MALTSSDSLTIVSVSGELEKVFDLRTGGKLRKIFKKISKFTISKELQQMARTLEIEPPGVVNTYKILFESIMAKDWRINPVQFDVPSNSQIFGHLNYMAGIEGILYRSNFTGSDCLAIFPNNFKNSESYIQLDDSAPSEKVPDKIDSSNWDLCNSSFNQIP